LRLILWTSVLTACMATSALWIAPAAASAPRQTSTTVLEASNASLGTILTDASGMTLYILSSEVGGTIKCSGNCLKVWPPLTVASGATPTGPADLPGKLATVTRPDGTLQVTYQGYPLYHFARDTAPGDTHGHLIDAFEGVWLAARPNAVPLSATPVASARVKISNHAGSALGTVRIGFSLAGHEQTRICSASCTLSAPAGSTVRLHAHAASGAAFRGWAIARPGKATSLRKAATTTVRMSPGLRISARFDD
jgi:predicted lipoprotein with Yx(FWY)xxD motif